MTILQVDDSDSVLTCNNTFDRPETFDNATSVDSDNLHDYSVPVYNVNSDKNF